MNNLETMVNAPVLTPFLPINQIRCRSCGARCNRLDKFWSLLRGISVTIVNPRYCAGGKPPTESKGMMSALMTGEAEAFNPCAGITEPHIHVSCRGCNYQWLMRTKEGKL